MPLLWFGVFDAPERIARDDLEADGRAYAGPLAHEWDAAAYAARFAKVHDHQLVIVLGTRAAFTARPSRTSRPRGRPNNCDPMNFIISISL